MTRRGAGDAAKGQRESGNAEQAQRSAGSARPGAARAAEAAGLAAALDGAIGEDARERRGAGDAAKGQRESGNAARAQRSGGSARTAEDARREPARSPAGVELTEEEQGIICRRHPVNLGAVIAPDGEVLGAEWPEGQYAREVMEYVTGCACGEIIAGADRMLACVRFLRFLGRADLDVRTEDADFIIRMIETTFKHRQGEALDGSPMRGKPFLLEPWQKFIVYGIMIFYLPGTNERLVKEAFIFIPRKNGKTIFIAALSWALGWLSRASGARVYVVGAALKQAMETFGDWLYVVEGSMYGSRKAAQRDGWRILDNNMEHSISHEKLMGGSISLNALPGNPDKQDSLNSPFVIADEAHAYKTPKQYNVLKEAGKAYTNKLAAIITTAGDNGTGFCAKRVEYCRKVLRGTVRDDQYFIFMCSADKDEAGDVDFISEVQHRKANPNWGVTIRPADIMNDAMQALNDPQQRKDFLAKSLNVFTSALNAYFNIDEFRRSNDRAEAALGIDPAWTVEKKIKYIARLGVTWYGGADLSKLHDLTAACLHGQKGEIEIVIPHCWFPIVAAAEKADKDEIPLFGWRDDGWLDMCNAPTNNHQAVVDWFVRMKKAGFKIAQVGHDRKFCREYYIGMRQAGFTVVDQPQYFYKKSEGFRHIEAKAKNGQLYYLGAEPYEYCVSNVRAIEKTDDMVQYEKIQPEHRIDVFDADVFACVRMLECLEKAGRAAAWFGEDKS